MTTNPGRRPIPANAAGEGWRTAPWPGEMKPFESRGKHAGYTIACPDCTTLLAINTALCDIGQKDAFWIESGSLEAGTLSLSPSIVCRACGWHGYLRNNLFTFA